MEPTSSPFLRRTSAAVRVLRPSYYTLMLALACGKQVKVKNTNTGVEISGVSSLLSTTPA
jgi:hypothetical protein